MSYSQFLANIFVPPNFITLPSVGVDISDTSLKYVGFTPTLRQRKARHLELWGDIDIPEDVLLRGEIKNIDLLTEALKEFKKQTKREFIRVSLPEERAYIFETEIRRDVPIKEIQSLLEFRLEENVPIPAREALFDYEVLPVPGRATVVKVVVAAYQREVIMQYYEACRKADLIPLSFEVEAQAMGRAVIDMEDTDTVMLVDFGKTRTGVGIVSHNTLFYTSTIDIGGGQLSQALRKVLGEKAEAELTEIKNTEGLVPSLSRPEVYEALLSTVSVIKDEIASRMQYWHLKNKKNEARRIKKVILCGGSVNLKGLPEYLSESLGVTSLRADVWRNAFRTDLVVPLIDKRHSYGYATAIGLALKATV
jgi:type IV pilus assembly protein PilM